MQLALLFRPRVPLLCASVETSAWRIGWRRPSSFTPYPAPSRASERCVVTPVMVGYRSRHETRQGRLCVGDCLATISLAPRPEPLNTY